MTVRLPRSDWILIAAAALLLTLAYPPFTLVVPAFICLIPAALLILHGAQDANAWRRHLHQGFWYGTITHGVLLYWLAMALWEYGRSAIALYLVAVVILGGATAVMFAAVGRIARRSPNRLLFALPAGIVVLEWLVAQMGPIAFPWHQLALTVTAFPVLVQSADLAGAEGLGFILATINVSLAMAWWTRRRPKVALAHVEMAATVLFLVTLYGLHRHTAVQALDCRAGGRLRDVGRDRPAPAARGAVQFASVGLVEGGADGFGDSPQHVLRLVPTA